jgi:glutathione-independent formaldehyde dehydrogenase
MCPAGQPPRRRRRNLLKNSTNDRLPILTIVNAKAINPEDAQTGYAQFHKGIAAKLVPDPYGLLAKAA